MLPPIFSTDHTLCAFSPGRRDGTWPNGLIHTIFDRRQQVPGSLDDRALPSCLPHEYNGLHPASGGTQEGMVFRLRLA